MSLTTASDAWQLPAVDPPAAPAKGMSFWVQTGTHWSIGRSFIVSRVNSRSFYVSANGRKSSHRVVDWHAWLLQREREGRVTLNGHPLRSVQAAPLSAAFAGAGRDEEDDMDRRGLRDARILRAVQDVVKGYALTEVAGEAGGRRTFRLARGREHSYCVRVDPTWRTRPACDCPDAVERLAAEQDVVFCKHVVAVLLQTEDLRHQLIDLFL
jgi:hypothetical protein